MTKLTKSEPFVSTAGGILAIVATLAGVSFVMLGAALLSSEYKSSCAPDAAGKQVCTSSFEWKGWAGIPLEGLASTVGIASGAYVVFIKKQRPGGGDDATATAIETSS
jgi:hypothetical protein